MHVLKPECVIVTVFKNICTLFLYNFKHLWNQKYSEVTKIYEKFHEICVCAEYNLNMGYGYF